MVGRGKVGRGEKNVGEEKSVPCLWLFFAHVFFAPSDFPSPHYLPLCFATKDFFTIKLDFEPDSVVKEGASKYGCIFVKVMTMGKLKSRF